MTLIIKELSDSPEDFNTLTRFYNELYIANFPDPDERESLANMKRYLQLKQEGWYGKNSYHIILAFDGDKIVAASVSDYLAIPNCGIIEFILVDEAVRGRAFGKTVHDATVKAFNQDAQKQGHTSADGVVIELNDPFRVAPVNDNYDPFERAMIWDRWGYGRLCFPYTQPALSADQNPVTCLLLAMKSLAPQFRHEVPTTLVRDVLEGYMKWAMRIEDPKEHAVFAEMQGFLSQLPGLQIEPLSHYIGRDPDKPLSVTPITAASDPAFDSVTGIYARAFPPGPASIDVAMFAHALKWFPGRADVRYHLWALSEKPGAPVAGMVSFFTMQRFGFGGYAALEPPLKGSGRIGTVLRRVEEQMIRDSEEAQYWYIECVPGSPEETIFQRLGFAPVPVEYYQPPLSGGEGLALRVTLLMKRLGCDYGRAEFPPAGFLDDLKVLLAEVYRLKDPESSRSFQVAKATLKS